LIISHEFSTVEFTAGGLPKQLAISVLMKTVFGHKIYFFWNLLAQGCADSD